MRLLFTVAIPTYNNESTVSKAIDSCIIQTYAEPYEVLIVNNCSTDSTPQILERYSDNQKVRIVNNPETCTLFENHNVCLRHAKGQYVLFCHSDDTLDQSTLQIIANKLAARNYPEKYVLWGHSLFRDYSDTLDNAGFKTGKLFAGIVAVRAFLDGGLTPSGTCYSKQFIEYGGFLPTTHRAAPSDSTSMIKAAMHGFRFEMMEDIVFYRRDASTANRGLGLSEHMDAIDDAWKYLYKELSDNVINDIVEQAGRLKHPSFNFYYAIANWYQNTILKILLKQTIKHPQILRHKIYWHVLARCIIKKRIA